MGIDEPTRTIGKLLVVGFLGVIVVVVATFAVMMRPTESTKTLGQVQFDRDVIDRLLAGQRNGDLIIPRSYDDYARLESVIDPEILVREPLGDVQTTDALLEAVDYEQWEAGESDSPFPEEGRAEVRAMKKIGLHCVVVEQLPLFDDFRMPSADGNAFVKDKVQRRADEITGWLDGTETTEQLHDMIWGGDPDGNQASLRDWCLAEPDARL